MEQLLNEVSCAKNAHSHQSNREFSLFVQVKKNVQQKFNEIRAALHMREKLLLRQLEVIANAQQQQSAPVYIDGNVNKGSVHEEKEKGKEECQVRFVTGDNGDEEKLLLAIRSFGQFQLDSNLQLALHRTRDNKTTAGLRNEDYIEPEDDHETMYKCLEDRDRDHNIGYFDLHDEVQPEAIVVDFSRSKALLEDNAKRSIINITLQEAKDLIRRAKIKRETYVPPLNLEELDDELESSIADAVSSLGRSCSEQSAGKPKPKTRKPRFKPKITINNCNGTINLRNIASLTINCASEDAVSAELPLTEAPTAAAAAATGPHSSSSDSISTSSPSSSNDSSIVSSRSQSKKQKASKRVEPTKEKREQQVTTSSSIESTPTQPTSTETHDVTCDFYNRLLNEIKKSLKEKPKRAYEMPLEGATTTATTATTTTTATSNTEAAVAEARHEEPGHVSSTQSETNQSTLSSHLQPGRRLVLKNFENLKIILEANSGDEDSFHPVQIEQWLAEIISETDLEPMQNTDILEHSKINSNSEGN